MTEFVCTCLPKPKLPTGPEYEAHCEKPCIPYYVTEGGQTFLCVIGDPRGFIKLPIDMRGIGRLTAEGAERLFMDL